MTTSNNPPAFPSDALRNQDEADWILHPGMTLRDWFAGQALGQIIATCAGDSRDRDQPIEAMFAHKAYELADAMLSARSVRSETDV